MKFGFSDLTTRLLLYYMEKPESINCCIVYYGSWHTLKFFFFFTLWPNILAFIEEYISTNKSSRPEVFCEKGVLKNFTKVTGKHLCQSLFFNKVADLRPATLLKKRLWNRCFPVNFVKFLRTPIFFRTPMVAASILR